MIDFVWDTRKNAINKKKHGISFEEARDVFYDENAIRYFDPDHSEEEDRFLMLGMSAKLKVLVVSHCHWKMIQQSESYRPGRLRREKKRHIGGKDHEKRI